jgi:hypothetical protein
LFPPEIVDRVLVEKAGLADTDQVVEVTVYSSRKPASRTRIKSSR